MDLKLESVDTIFDELISHIIIQTIQSRSHLSRRISRISRIISLDPIISELAVVPIRYDIYHLELLVRHQSLHPGNVAEYLFWCERTPPPQVLPNDSIFGRELGQILATPVSILIQQIISALEPEAFNVAASD